MDKYKVMDSHEAMYRFWSGRTFAEMESTEDILFVIYILIGVPGFLMNLILILTILRSHSLQFFHYNILLVNLFVSNILMALFCVPFTFISLTRRTWDYGNFSCKLIPALQGIGFGVSCATVTIAAIDRYIEVKKAKTPPVGVYYSKRNRVIIESIIIWTCGILFTLPAVYYYKLLEVPVNYTLHNDHDDGGQRYSASNRTTTFYHCVQQWPPGPLGSIYSITIFLLQAVIPVIVLAVTSMFINRHSTEVPQNRRTGKNNVLHDESIQRTLLVVTMSFTVCMIPLNVVHVLLDTSIIVLSVTDLYLLLAIVHAIAMVSIPLNAIVYGWLTPSIRRDLIPSICTPKVVPPGIIELAEIDGAAADQAIM